MSEPDQPPKKKYTPDTRLNKIYLEASLLDNDGLESLCPSFTELAQNTPRYQEDSIIGEGALKTVSRAFDRKTQRWVALAQLQPERYEDYYDHFVHEAWLVASLSHPNIIKVLDTGVYADGRPFFTMDLKGKSTLATLVKSTPTPSLRELLQVFVKVCDAISYAHSKNIVHLDLKPENIQSDAFGEVVVCDWGLGKSLSNDEYKHDTAYYENGSHDNMTLFGQLKGSLGYMAPEQATPNGKKDTRTDIYSLGCILHFILTGEAPFKGSRKTVLEETAKSEIKSLRTSYPDQNIPESLDAVVTKAMSLDPSDRYRSVPRLQKEIERFLTGYATRAEKPGFFREAALFLKRNLLPTIISAIALLSIGVLSTIYAQHLAHKNSLVKRERERADQLLDEVDILDDEYSSFVKNSKESKKALAKTMAKSARHTRGLSIFERPIDAIRMSRKMAQIALEQDPSCMEAHTQLFAINCLQLNYKSALTSPTIAATVEIDPTHGNFVPLAKAFPHFDFTRRKRPTTEELISLINTAHTLHTDLLGHLERVIAYDSAIRSDKSNYPQVIEALLQYKYGGADKLTLHYDDESSTITLWSNQDISLLGQKDYWKCLLRFLQYRTLKLEIKGRFHLSDLNDQPIETLDISQCDNIQLKKSIQLPQLRNLIIRPNQLAPDTLNELINAHESLIITEEQPEPQTALQPKANI